MEPLDAPDGAKLWLPPAVDEKFEISRLDALIHALTCPINLDLDTSELTKDQPQRFSRRQVKLACMKHEELVVIGIDRYLLVGGADQYGDLVFPTPHLQSQGVEWFVQENREQWVMVPRTGYKVIWRSIRLQNQIELYPVLDAIESDLKLRECLSRATLQEKITKALGLQDLIVPIGQS